MQDLHIHQFHGLFANLWCASKNALPHNHNVIQGSLFCALLKTNTKASHSLKRVPSFYSPKLFFNIKSNYSFFIKFIKFIFSLKLKNIVIIFYSKNLKFMLAAYYIFLILLNFYLKTHKKHIYNHFANL